MIYKTFIVFLMMFLLPANTLAVSWARTLSSKEDIAEFCFQVAKDGSLDLKIKRNIDIELPLLEVDKFVVCDDKWHPQMDLDEVYEVEFPKEWNCNTLEPLWYIKTCKELQDYFSNKKITKLSQNVSHNCETSEKQIDGRMLEARFILEIKKNPVRIFSEIHSYKFTKLFKAKVSGRCSDGKQGK